MLKRYIILVAMLLATTLAQANGEYQRESHKGKNTSAADAAALSGALSGASVDSHDRVTNQGTDLSRAIPSVVVPNPAVGFAVCDSAYTFGGSFSGVGAAIGIPVSDEQCNLREDAKTTKLLGEPVIAKEMMCTNVRFFKSSYRAGRPCFPDKEMLQELSGEEMEIYHNIVEHRNAAEALAISKAQPIRADDLIRRGKLSLSTKNGR